VSVGSGGGGVKAGGRGENLALGSWRWARSEGAPRAGPGLPGAAEERGGGG